MKRLSRVPRYIREKWYDQMASLLAAMIPMYLNGAKYAKYFTFWESRGFHIVRNHFYEPIPDIRSLRDEIWERESQLAGVDMNIDRQIWFLREVFPKYKAECDELASRKPMSDYDFHFDNPNFSGTDALVLWCMARHFRPKTIVEVGGGFSTRLLAEAALKNGDTQLVCVEPYPDSVLKRGFPGLAKLITDKVENLGMDVFSSLSSNDILFIDASHCLRIGGDVSFLYLEVLPRLAKGVIIHIHDIFFPKEMPREWVLGTSDPSESYRFWTEQYLVQAFLAFNSAFEVLFCNSYMGLKCPQDMRIAFPKPSSHRGSSLWIRRRNRRGLRGSGASGR